MSKLWHRKDEWTDHAPCAGNIDFIISPEKLGPERTENVKATCAGCPVRPECIEMNTKPVADFWRKALRPSNGIWVAGEWLPERQKVSKEVLEEKREQLLARLPEERRNRPDHML
ncbi:WhiB family transcription factor [Mycobacterium phage Reindeer]|uniref:WhiB family transcription factor n=1 Tax=Mycobacterium phage Reindeer TaxID=2762283 RepID=A0A7G8LI10_9CAUD|nr:transcriptional regulator WhiB-like [Mycobacterium phage Reindeer]QNJ56882.1 WhiB family transcription factor [Mycobacterium phage Reindeer]